MNRPIQNDTQHSRIQRESMPRRAETRKPGKTAPFREVFGGAKQAAAAPKENAPAAASPYPPTPAGLPDLFAPAAFENRMNQWLMGILSRQNEVRMQLYRNAVEGWKNVNARNRELGIPEIPPPPPPELAKVEPMEPGWWFRIHG